jgi:hypothetical protein
MSVQPTNALLSGSPTRALSTPKPGFFTRLFLLSMMLGWIELRQWSDLMQPMKNHGQRNSKQSGPRQKFTHNNPRWNQNSVPIKVL